MRKPIRSLDLAELFPPIDEELDPFRHHFKGRILNAGAGSRDISHLVEGELFNQDIKSAEQIDFAAPLHKIPVDDGFFDAIICNAVLEHVPNPDEVVEEFRRVTRPGGILYLCVPFMQPLHADPGDYQRYTREGLELLVERHGFEVTESGPVHSVYVTLAWVIHDWLAPKRSFGARMLKALVYPALRRQARRRSDEQVPTLASAFRVLAVRS